VTLTRARSRSVRRDGGKPGDGVKGAFSGSLLPEASFLQVLRLGSLLLGESSTPDGLLSRAIGELNVSKEIARMAAEALLRGGFLQRLNGAITATDKLHAFDRALARAALDEASDLWSGYLPYQAMLELLKEQGALGTDALPDLLTPALGGKPGKDACERLVRAPVYLAQAWTDDHLVRDGTRRPTDEDCSAAWREAFATRERDGICRISELLPEFCRRARMTPWAAGRQMARIVQEGGLSDLSFQSAAGKRPVARDQVVEGPLQAIRATPVPLDRIDIGGRPVFTVSRR
jgi:hypothetical protein